MKPSHFKSRPLPSRTLKPFEETAGDEAMLLPADVKMTLCFTESGCLPARLDDETVFILKDDRDIIGSLRESDKIVFGFECIKRPEFPSIRMYFELQDAHNKSYKFDCLFNIESDEEIELLTRLKKQDHFDIFFYDSETRYFKRVGVDEEDRRKIKAALDEAAR